MMGGFSMGMGGVGSLWMVIFWIVIVVVAVWLLGRLFPRSNTVQPPAGPEGSLPESAVDIVKRRYARGEISREEYEAIRHGLEHSGSRPGGSVG
jgi:putative membrane protein